MGGAWEGYGRAGGVVPKSKQKPCLAVEREACREEPRVYASRERKQNVELRPSDERTFRLPPMSEGPVVVKVHDADFA